MRSYKMRNIVDEKEMLLMKWKMEEDEIKKCKGFGKIKDEVRKSRK